MVLDYLDGIWRDKGRTPRVGFIGLGVSNGYLLGRLYGGNIELSVRTRDKIADSERLPSVRYFSGVGYLSTIYEDILFLAPSARPDGGEILRAISRGAIISSDLDVLLSRPREIYAVSGSDGKTTTATLTEALITDCALVGNIGIPFSSIDAKVYVAELSSFQLFNRRVPTRAATLTSLSGNHLDWHKSPREYIETKLSLLTASEMPSLSYDSPALAEYSRGNPLYAVYSVRQGYTELKGRVRAEHIFTLEDGYVARCGERIIPTEILGRKEWYNVSNLMGAMALAWGKFDKDRLYEVATSFRGVPERCEMIGSYQSHPCYSSSIDTTPSRLSATLSALGRRVVLILGGVGKGLSILTALPEIIKWADGISLYGRAGEEFYKELQMSCQEAGIRLEYSPDFTSSTIAAVDMLEGEAALLLSPAAASYGEFKNYTERAERYREILAKLGATVHTKVK